MTFLFLLINALYEPGNIAPVWLNVSTNNSHILVVLLLKKNLGVYFVFYLCQLFWTQKYFLIECCSHLNLCYTFNNITTQVLVLANNSIHDTINTLLLNTFTFGFEPTTIWLCLNISMIHIFDLGHHVDDLFKIVLWLFFHSC